MDLLAKSGHVQRKKPKFTGTAFIKPHDRQLFTAAAALTCCLNYRKRAITYTNMTAELELLDGLALLNVLLKALAMSWKAEGDEAELWLSDGSPSWPESV